MTQLGEAIARYNKLLESEQHRDLGWAEAMRGRMTAGNLTLAGRPVSPFLRPHFITRRQYQSLVKAAEALFQAIDRIKQMALASTTLLSRLHLLPAEKMLAAIDPGYPFLAVTSLLDTHLDNGSLRFVNYNADTPIGVAYAEALADLYYTCPPVQEFRRRYNLSRLSGGRHLLNSFLRAYKEFGGKKVPQIAILEFRQPFQSPDPGEYVLLREQLLRAGYATELVSPDQLEYKGGVLRAGGFTIDLIYRRVKVQDFLLRFDLSHPLVRAYRDRAVCLVNSFRSELAHKRALFDLLTDETVTASFPAAEKRAIRDYIPWTRLVASGKTVYRQETVDLLDFILKNREKLVLKPNDDSAGQHTFRGVEMDDAGWARALRTATRTPYVVQEYVPPTTAQFPVHMDGRFEMRELQVDLHPHAFLGKVEGCSAWLSASGPSGFSSLAGIVPTFILESKS